MAESRDPAIKLFGKTIQIPVELVVSVAIGEEFIGDEKVPSNKEARPNPKNNNEEAPTTTEAEKKIDESNNSANEEKSDHNSSPENSTKADDEQNESNNKPQTKCNKKPDKILPCPRCKSMDTKFCYYNNYNVNQPRHFCKNCQRYWTAGGSMRNVPVGAGRRKSKSSACNQHFRQITIPDCVQPLKSNGTVLSFACDAPLGESMASAMKLVEKTAKNCNQSVEEQLSEPAKVSSNSNCHGFAQNVSNFNGSPWAYPWTHPPLAFPFYPISAYWSMPWLSPQLANSPNLGKRSREGNLLSHNYSDEGNNASWDSGMIKTDLLSGGGGLFKAFQSKGGHKIHSPEVSQVLLANPAALSRSFTFQESS